MTVLDTISDFIAGVIVMGLPVALVVWAGLRGKRNRDRQPTRSVPDNPPDLKGQDRG